MIVEQLGTGDDYEKINPVVTFVILAENRYDDDIYHHHFVDYDLNAKIVYSELTEKHVLELAKLPDKDDGTDVWAWGRIILADNEKELDMLAAKSTVMQKAVASIKHCSSDAQMRELAESYEKARMDEAVRRRAAVNETVQLYEVKLREERAKIADRDAIIADKDAELARLRAIIENSNA